MPLTLPPSWKPILAPELKQPYFTKLKAFVEAERQTRTIYPPEKDVLNAFKLTPYENVSVFLLGQDPYFNPGQAHGLCFSVRPHVNPLPPSLVNIFKELHDDLGCKIPNNGYLRHWADQGILMLNAVLTVRAGHPNSHKGKGWERFSDATLKAINDKPDPVVFVLWGSYAIKKEGLIDTSRHVIIKCSHPSPLSAKSKCLGNPPFFGSRPFSKINSALREAGKPEIDWQIPDV